MRTAEYRQHPARNHMRPVARTADPGRRCLRPAACRRLSGPRTPVSTANDSLPELGGPAGPEAWARIGRLRVVRNLSEVIRRWFRVEIAFADSTGYVRAF